MVRRRIFFTALQNHFFILWYDKSFTFWLLMLPCLLLLPEIKSCNGQIFFHIFALVVVNIGTIKKPKIETLPIFFSLQDLIVILKITPLLNWLLIQQRRNLTLTHSKANYSRRNNIHLTLTNLVLFIMEKFYFLYVYGKTCQQIHTVHQFFSKSPVYSFLLVHGMKIIQYKLWLNRSLEIFL